MTTMNRRDFVRATLLTLLLALAIPKRWLPRWVRDDTAYVQGIFDRGGTLPSGDYVIRVPLMLGHSTMIRGSYFTPHVNPWLEVRDAEGFDFSHNSVDLRFIP